jgi:hypothetical protein
MRGFDHLLQDHEDREEAVARRLSDSTCFWISYSVFLIGIGAVSMWAFFKYVVMG